MKLNPVISLGFTLVVALSQPASGTQLPDARQKLEELGSAMRGAAVSTRRRVLEDFRRDLDGLRQGATITIEAQITGLRENSLLGFVTTVLDAAVVVQCPKGHQLPTGHDFQFCPYCGESLR